MGPPPLSISAVVPVFNESGSLASALDRLDAALRVAPGVERFEILAVDDGSTDGSFSRLSAPVSVRVLRHERNRGYGAALKTGIRQAAFGAILICDADGTYPTEELPRLAAAYGPGRLVVAKREAILYPRWRLAKLLSRELLGLWLLSLTFRRIEDVNSGFRLFPRKDALEVLDDLSDRFSFTTGLTLSWIYAGKPLVYVPAPYGPRIGESKVRFLRDAIRVFAQTVRLTLKRRPSRLLPWCAAAAAALGLVFS